MSAVKVGIAYVLIVFAAGFALGAIRVTFIAPATGSLVAVLIELPFMLLASWFMAKWVLGTFQVPATIFARTVMGLVAFALLMIIEALFGAVFGRSLESQLKDLLTPAGMAGLTGQILFGLMPLLLLRNSHTS